MATQDSDFDPIRDEPAFKELLERETGGKSVATRSQRPSCYRLMCCYQAVSETA